MRFAVIIVLLLLAAQVSEPCVTRLSFDQTTPRPIEARGNLSDTERSIIALFDQVSPSVVQVVGRQTGGYLSNEEGEGLQSGTGFSWEGAGNVVTNNHVINGTNEVVVRLSSGDVIPADIVETAPNYDLAVVRLRNSRQLPPAIAIGSSADLKVGQFAFAIGHPSANFAFLACQ